jgi:hypothetical protein
MSLTRAYNRSFRSSLRCLAACALVSGWPLLAPRAEAVSWNAAESNLGGHRCACGPSCQGACCCERRGRAEPRPSVPAAMTTCTVRPSPCGEPGLPVSTSSQRVDRAVACLAALLPAVESAIERLWLARLPWVDEPLEAPPVDPPWVSAR